MINLFTSYYDCGDPSRQEEIDRCFLNNIHNDAIDRLIVMIDDDASLPATSQKVTRIDLDHRPTYLDWIDLTEELGLQGVSLLSNSDIYFDEAIKSAKDVFQNRKTFLALSRWEDEKGAASAMMHKNPHWSQDVWGVHSEQKIDASIKARLKFPMGVPRCDNKVAYIFAIYGWAVSNPCKWLKSYHVHNTQMRTYDKKLDDRILGGVAYVPPSDSLVEASKVQIDIWAKGTKAIEKVALNKSYDKWEAEAEQNTPPQASKVELPGVEELFRSGEEVFSSQGRFGAYKRRDHVALVDALSPGSNEVVCGTVNDLQTTGMEYWFRPVIETSPLIVGSRPKSHDDVNFWQYPCSTEEQAFLNHLVIPRGANVDHVRRRIDCYLPLPWATLIDKGSLPDKISRALIYKMQGYKTLADELGYAMHVHTVCQHIHWVRILDHVRSLGVTDLHLSHLENNSEQRVKGTGITLHPWPLIAVNVEIEDRRTGLELDKSVNDKAIFASFIGSHMKHYRSTARELLFKYAQLDGGRDLLVEVGSEWHFNKIVYDQQVQNKSVSDSEQSAHDEKTARYNSILSNSKFSLCPEGAGPNSLRVWESMAVGAVPVIIADEWIPPSPTTKDIFDDLVVRVRLDELEGLFSMLRSIPLESLAEKSAACRRAYLKYRDRVCF